MSFAAFLSMAVELADCTRPVSFVAGSTFAFFGLATLFGGRAAVAKFLAAPARRSHAAGLHGTARVKQGCQASAAGHAGGRALGRVSALNDVLEIRFTPAPYSCSWRKACSSAPWATPKLLGATATSRL